MYKRTRSPRRILLIASVALATLMVVAACGSSGPDKAAEAPAKVTFMAGFKPQANLPFVTAYVAQEKGYFAEQGLGFDPRVLSEGKVDVLVVFRSNEPDTLARLGHPVRLFRPDDFGVPTMGLTYIATTETIADNSDVVERFLKATMRAFAFVLENEEETLDIVMTFAPQEDREHQRFMLREELRNAEGPVTQSNGLGAMTGEQWQALYDQLLEFEALTRPFDYRTAYDDQFIRAIYDGTKLQWP